ncbi:hypothetical protein QE152_g6196 [Popillia japonica]|uniref:Transmembrane protein 245 n=1 Tax=Popillia japonica TaxID=7064 RepID=A0AAW1MI45_POPJA
MDYRSPLENIINIFGSLPQGHDKPVKQAVYNALALFLLFLGCAAACALYLILEPFIKPLMWALLVGSVLHPLKYKLAQRFKSWFDGLDDSNTPVVFGILLVPVNVTDNISELLGNKLLNHLKIIISVLIIIPCLHLIYFYTPKFLVNFVIHTSHGSSHFIAFLIDNANTALVICLLLGYVTAIFFLWSPKSNFKFHCASTLVWFLVACYLANLCGSLKIVVFIILQLLFLGGFFLELYYIQQYIASTGSDLTLFDYLRDCFKNKSFVILNNSEGKDGKEKIIDTKIVTSDSPTEVKDETDKSKSVDPWTLELFQKNSASESKDKRTGILITDKGNIHVIKQPESETFTTTFLAPKIKRSLSQPSVSSIHRTRYGVWQWLYGYWKQFSSIFAIWFNDRYDALVPIHIRGLCKVTYNVNYKFKQAIKESIDTVSSCVVIFGLIIFVICASIFIAIQIYAEGIMLVQMTSNVINQTVVHNPELRQLLPPTFDDTVDSLLDNAYQYGREGISKVVKSIMSDVDPAKSEKFEKQVLELWDRIYQTWMTTDHNGPKVTQEAVQHSWDRFVTDIQKSPELFNFNGIIAFLKQNIGTLLSLLESIWSIVKGNMGLLIGSFSAFMSILLGGGTAVLNFMLNTIIFLTTLFYLLSSSNYLYKPVEVMSNFSSSSSRFGLAFGAAINGVFTASFKMVVFYGMWTWFIHNLFGVKIVYIPTVLASVLAAAPFLGTYWACFPAVLDLWLAQAKPFYAILMAIFQFLPTSIVDTTIYGEIKGGGHPYLTGLAIAGGIFCLGIEGAIIGPLILCGLYVAIDLSSNLFKDSPSEESISLHHLSR